ncbi:MAG: nucleoside kinase, partial [Desulfitobacteriaceae bacterium]
PVLSRSGSVQHCRLVDYPPGFILLYTANDQTDSCPLYIPPEKLSATFSESQRWVENLRLANVGDVNAVIHADRSNELISLAEALHEKKISLIADRILEQRKHVRVILVSGPSSSGKTTFAQRLSTQLRVNGLRPVALSLDNYFLSRENTPLDTNGQYDFEALEALDLPLLDAHLNTLIKGGMIETPIFDFISGNRRPQGSPMYLNSNEILIIEGIHGLNPRLLPSLNRNHLFKIYISALFQSNLDSYNRVPTTEVRLIRRLVRDVRTRGIDPERTLAQWSSVRRGENTNIFPYQEEADVMFNSSLLYELNALRSYAEPLLDAIPLNSPHHVSVTLLLRLLAFFNPLDTTKIPFNSILREFIGEGIYNI